MVARLERVPNGYAVILAAEAVEALHLTEGSMVEVRPAGVVPGEVPSPGRFATTEEVMRAFEKTLPQHEETYRELAK